MAKARGNGLDATKTSFFRANPGPRGALLGDSLLEARAAARKERGTCKISSGRGARRGRRSSGRRLVGVGRHGAGRTSHGLPRIVQLFEEVYPKLDCKCVQEFKLRAVRSRASHCTPSAAIGAMARTAGTVGTVGT